MKIKLKIYLKSYEIADENDNLKVLIEEYEKTKKL